MLIPSLFAKKNLGIDIGTSGIKMVELSSRSGKIKLENYGEISADALYQKNFRTFSKNILLLSTDDISKAIRAVMEEAKIKTNKCTFSIPDFSTFFTAFELPQMTAEELPQAIRTEARKHVPIPLIEAMLDWQIIEGRVGDKKTNRLKILLVVIPNDVIDQYQRIATAAGLQLTALEAEVFGLVRALVKKEEKGFYGLIDIGERSTTCSIIDNRILKTSFSFDVSGRSFTEMVSKGLSIENKVAEKLKRKYGILPWDVGLVGKNVGELLIPLVSNIARESDSVFKSFSFKEKKKIEKIILAGGGALLPGLLEYFKDYFKIDVEIANPFKNMFCPQVLEKNLKQMGPSYAVSVGMALRAIE